MKVSTRSALNMGSAGIVWRGVLLEDPFYHVKRSVPI